MHGLPNIKIINTTPASHDNANPLTDKLLRKNKLSKDIAPIEMKADEFVDGEPVVRWSEAEVIRMNTIENLQYAVVGKFYYGWPNMDELRKLIPQRCGTKRDCQIGYLRNRHILIRFKDFEDSVNIMSKSVYYITDKEGYSY
ncbi:hypothetical protein H5410_027935 [Solanum commersonii]|uniref:DUF4283 domain-containing protein n=1 Tax=Solanum commersonii TaxID=4109 RepID=A0A9J5Z0I9_SOLCO|nr:hypothetical protein H5410_027935 [Solanum commersonii]